MLDFSDQHNITCKTTIDPCVLARLKYILGDVEIITASPAHLAMAFDRTINADVRYRFVIDIAKTFND